MAAPIERHLAYSRDLRISAFAEWTSAVA
jgi:hypothetical protein